MTKVILLNGPPRCGKSLAASLLLAAMPEAREYKFTSPMDRAIPAFFGLSAERWAELREKEKDVPAAELFGWKPRSVLISFSEDWAKQLFGKKVFGQLAATGFLPAAPVVVCSDSGFQAEAEALADAVGVENCLQIRLYRNGCSFEGDSRSYWESNARAERPASLGILAVDVNNNGSVEDLKNSLVARVQDWVFMSGTQWTAEDVEKMRRQK